MYKQILVYLFVIVVFVYVIFRQIQSKNYMSKLRIAQSKTIEQVELDKKFVGKKISSPMKIYKHANGESMTFGKLKSKYIFFISGKLNCGSCYDKLSQIVLNLKLPFIIIYHRANYSLLFANENTLDSQNTLFYLEVDDWFIDNDFLQGPFAVVFDEDFRVVCIRRVLDMNDNDIVFMTSVFNNMYEEVRP